MRTRFPYLHYDREDGCDDVVRTLRVEENLDALLHHHTFNKLDFLQLHGVSVRAHARGLRNDTCITHYAFGAARFPVGNAGDQLGPYLTGTHNKGREGEGVTHDLPLHNLLTGLLVLHTFVDTITILLS